MEIKATERSVKVWDVGTSIEDLAYTHYARVYTATSVVCGQDYIEPPARVYARQERSVGEKRKLYEEWFGSCFI